MSFSASQAEIAIPRFCEPTLVLGARLKLYQAPERVGHLPSGIFENGPHDLQGAMWSAPYEGGLALAAYILKNPGEFQGKHVVDIGSGSGIVAIAAALVGAKVTAIESSEVGCAAITMNAKLNGVKIDVQKADFLSTQDFERLYSKAEILTAGDVFHRGDQNEIFPAFFAKLSARGATIFATSGEENLVEMLDVDGAKTEAMKTDRWARFVKLSPCPEYRAKEVAPCRPASFHRDLHNQIADLTMAMDLLSMIAKDGKIEDAELRKATRGFLADKGFTALIKRYGLE